MTEPESVTVTRATTNRALTALHRVADAFADPNSVRELAVQIDQQIDAKITRLLAKKAALRALLGALPALEHNTTTLGQPKPFMSVPHSPSIAPALGLPGIMITQPPLRPEVSRPSPNGAADVEPLKRDLVIACAQHLASTNGGIVRSSDIVKAMADRGHQFAGPRATTSVSRFLARSNGFTKEAAGHYRIVQPSSPYPPPPAVTPQH